MRNRGGVDVAPRLTAVPPTCPLFPHQPLKNRPSGSHRDRVDGSRRGVQWSLRLPCPPAPRLDGNGDSRAPPLVHLHHQPISLFARMRPARTAECPSGDPHFPPAIPDGPRPRALLARRIRNGRLRRIEAERLGSRRGAFAFAVEHAVPRVRHRLQSPASALRTNAFRAAFVANHNELTPDSQHCAPGACLRRRVAATRTAQDQARAHQRGNRSHDSRHGWSKRTTRSSRKMTSNCRPVSSVRSWMA